MVASKRAVSVALAASSLALFGCSSDDAASGQIERIDLREPVEDAGASEVANASNAVAGVSTEPPLTIPTEPVTIIEEPAQRLVDNPPIEATNWIARTFMDASSVELVWSPVEGADTYRLYRLATADANYDAIASGIIDGAEQIYEGPEFGFIDSDPPTGEFLTYLIVAEVGSDRTEPRWTEALTVDDVTPPTPITGLTATTTADGVLLEWEPSFDDVEFAAYNVSVLTDADQLQFIGGGADIGQVSFLDDEDFVGTRTYVVAAVDFHNNVSESAQIEVTR